jgi:nucleoside diphosphate kinase
VIAAAPQSVLEERDSLKRYERDTYFLEGIAEWPERVEPASLALLLIKPEAFVGGRLEAILDFLAEQRFAILAWREAVFTRHLCRALWLHEWWHVSLTRMVLVEALMQAGPSVVVILEDPDAATNQSGSKRLQALKGPTIPSRRQSHHLRARLASPSMMLNFVHTADGSAELVREVAVLFDVGERDELFADMALGRELDREVVEAPLREEFGAAAWAHRRHDLAYRPAVERALRALRRGVGRKCPDFEDALLRTPPKYLPFADLEPLRAAVTDEASLWDWLVVAATIASLRESD